MELLKKSISAGFDRVIANVKNSGSRIESRGYSTRELTNFKVRFADPYDRFIWHESEPEYQLLQSEIETVKAGEEPDVQFPELDDKLDLDDGTFYESIIRERISQDWDEWVRLLSEDKQTRKACSLFGSEPDPPCTSRLQWMIRDGRLNCYSYNRSQEMTFAFPMDVGLFETYQVQLAEELGVDVGYHEHIMTSAHIYESDL